MQLLHRREANNGEGFVSREIWERLPPRWDDMVTMHIESSIGDEVPLFMGVCVMHWLGYHIHRECHGNPHTMWIHPHHKGSDFELFHVHLTNNVDTPPPKRNTGSLSWDRIHRGKQSVHTHTVRLPLTIYHGNRTICQQTQGPFVVNCF